MSDNSETVFGPDQEDPIDRDRELEEEIQEQAEKTVPLNRFPSGPRGFIEDTTDTESGGASDEYEEVTSYGATATINDYVDEFNNSTNNQTIYHKEHNAYLFQSQHEMVNLPFSLPGDLHKCGMDTDTGGEILTRVAVLLTQRLE